MNTKLLFPHRFKKIGWMLLVPSLALGFLLTFYNPEQEFLRINAFTIYSSGFLSGGSKFFGFTKVDYSATLVGLLIIISATLVAFSKEKSEDEFIAKIRLESLLWAVYVNNAVLLFCTLFFFDFEFLLVLEFNTFTVLLIFIIRFNYILYKTNKAIAHEKQA